MRVALDTTVLAMLLSVHAPGDAAERRAIASIADRRGVELVVPAPALAEVLAYYPAAQQAALATEIRRACAVVSMGLGAAMQAALLGIVTRNRPAGTSRQEVKWDAAIVGVAAHERPDAFVTLDRGQAAMARRASKLTVGTPAEILAGLA